MCPMQPDPTPWVCTTQKALPHCCDGSWPERSRQDTPGPRSPPSRVQWREMGQDGGGSCGRLTLGVWRSLQLCQDPKAWGCWSPTHGGAEGDPGIPLLWPPQGLGSCLARSSLFLGPDLSVRGREHFTDCRCLRWGWGGGTWWGVGWHQGDGGWDSSSCCSERGAPPSVPAPASHSLATWPSRLLTHPQGLHHACCSSVHLQATVSSPGLHRTGTVSRECPCVWVHASTCEGMSVCARVRACICVREHVCMCMLELCRRENACVFV